MADEFPSVPELLQKLRDGTQHLVSMARDLQFPFDPGIADLRKRHTMYVRNLVTAYVSKFAELSETILQSVEREQYLTYALCGRALIETTALLRYHVVEEYQPLFFVGELNDDDLKKLIEIDERHLRGSHFDWQSFLLENYGKMREAAIARLNSKKGKGPPLPPGPKPPRIGDCIKSWAREGPAIQIIYDLFCDLVHPNVGSSFLVASIKDFVFYFSPYIGNRVGEQIFEQSFLMLLSASQKPFGEYLGKLIMTGWPDDQLAP
jgi:hypothetical protein